MSLLSFVQVGLLLELDERSNGDFLDVEVGRSTDMRAKKMSHNDLSDIAKIMVK